MEIFRDFPNLLHMLCIIIIFALFVLCYRLVIHRFKERKDQIVRNAHWSPTAQGENLTLLLLYFKVVV